MPIVKCNAKCKKNKNGLCSLLFLHILHDGYQDEPAICSNSEILMENE